jgi:hypothetical protein
MIGGLLGAVDRLRHDAAGSPRAFKRQVADVQQALDEGLIAEVPPRSMTRWHRFGGRFPPCELPTPLRHCNE